MLRKLLEWLRPTLKTPEELAAQQEALRLRAEIKAQRLGDSSSGSNLSHRGRDGR